MLPLALAQASAAPAGGPSLGTTLVVVAALSIVPFLLVTLSSFLKIAVVLALLRNAIGAPQVPPTIVVTGLALVLSLVVMAPVAGAAAHAAEPPLRRATAAGWTTPPGAAALAEAARRAREPLAAFLERHAAPRDRTAFVDLARGLRPAEGRAAVGERDLLVLAPAFATTELKEAFQIGFLLFLPFLVVDLFVALVLQALGLGALPATHVALPFKLLLFVLVDGWLLLARGLLVGYA